MKVFIVKEKYELGNNINSKVLAFAFALSAARKKAEGKKLGRPKGSLSKHTKLSGKEEQIQELLDKKVSYSAIGRILGVHRVTVKQFVQSRKLF